MPRAESRKAMRCSDRATHLSYARMLARCRRVHGRLCVRVGQDGHCRPRSRRLDCDNVVFWNFAFFLFLKNSVVIRFKFASLQLWHVNRDNPNCKKSQKNMFRSLKVYNCMRLRRIKLLFSQRFLIIRIPLLHTYCFF